MKPTGENIVGIVVRPLLGFWSLDGLRFARNVFLAELKRGGVIPTEYGSDCFPSHMVFTFVVTDRNKTIQILRAVLNSLDLLRHSEIAWCDYAEGYWRKVHSTSPVDFESFVDAAGSLIPVTESPATDQELST